MNRIFDRLGWAFGGAALVALAVIVGGIVHAGPLDPTGPPASTAGVRLPGTPITQPTSFPIVINQAGSYYLAENIVGVAGQGGIQISAGNVTLDLNGFTLRGVGSSLDGIAVTASVENVVVRNGTITAWGGDGIDTTSGSGTHGLVKDVISSNNAGMGFRFSLSYSELRDCQAYGNGDTGATVSGDSNLVTRCAFAHNGTQGIRVSGTLNHIFENEANGNGIGNTGFWITGSNNTIEHNTAIANTSYGFWFDGGGNIGVANFASFNTGGAFGAQYNITGACIDCDIGPLNVAGNGPNYWANIDR